MTSYEDYASKLKVMGHPVRLQILDMLRQGEICVCHIEEALNKRQAYISQQLMTLREAELVQSRKDGLQVYYRLADTETNDLLDLLVGPLKTDELEILDDCGCPTCSTTSIVNPKEKTHVTS